MKLIYVSILTLHSILDFSLWCNSDKMVSLISYAFRNKDLTVCCGLKHKSKTKLKRFNLLTFLHNRVNDILQFKCVNLSVLQKQNSFNIISMRRYFDRTSPVSWSNNCLNFFSCSADSSYKNRESRRRE